jgi:hypothetical protein
VATAPAAAAGTRIDEKRAAAADGVITIDNFSGSITVTGWDRNEVRVSGTLSEEAKRLEFTGEGRRTRIKVVFPDWERHRSFDSEEIDSYLEVQVPRDSEVRASGINVKMSADRVTGSLELQTVNGNIDVSGSPAMVEAKTVNGGIMMTGTCPRAELETVNGDVTVSGVRGEVNVSSVSGDLHIEGDGVDRVHATSVSGDIRLEARPDRSAQIELQTHSGDVICTLPRSFSADYQVSTFSGDIENAIGPKPERKSKYGPPSQELSFTTGGGDARIVMSSFSGTVIIREAGSER